MKEVYFATTNSGKLHTMRNELARYEINAIHHPFNFTEPRTSDLKEIAKSKIWAAYNHLHKPCVALDAGFYIDAYDGFPESYVNLALEKLKIKGILKLLDGEFRGAEFRSCLAFMDENRSNPIYFESVIRGEVSTAPRGEIRDRNWSDLFLIFEPNGWKKTLAEMTETEYEKYREERREDSCFTKFARWYNEQ